MTRAKPQDNIERTAIFSPCKTWRYTLGRHWDRSKGYVLFILLNPSTADATYDDRTNVRGQGFARDWGFGGVVFVNLFAFRTKDPKVMKEAPDPIGPHNDAHIAEQLSNADQVVCAWGTDGTHRGRDRQVRTDLRQIPKDSGIVFPVYHLGLTKNGHPRHPLYLKADTPLTEWRTI